jgi:hypothetical protein
MDARMFGHVQTTSFGHDFPKEVQSDNPIEGQLCNHTDGIEEAYLHSSFQIHLNTPCSRLKEP